VKIKICGITNIDDARAAIEAGTDMLGFNFYAKSTRYIVPEKVREIAAQIRSGGQGPLLVGVFVNSPLDEVRSILEIAQIDLAQLHGDEPVSVVEQLHGRGFKALRPTSEAEAEIDAEWFAPYGPNAQGSIWWHGAYSRLVDRDEVGPAVSDFVGRRTDTRQCGRGGSTG